jgi:hypothetical protein
VVKSYADLGLANARDGRPNRLWYLLQEFAGHEGVYGLGHPSGLYPPKSVPGARRHSQPTAFSPKLGSELSDLREHLRRLFPGVAGDPIARYDKTVHAYRATVLLRWEPGYRQRKALA